MSEVCISDAREAIDRDRLHDFLSRRSYWAKGIPRAIMERSLEGSLCFTALIGGEMVGFARVVTDRATFAYLADVYVEEAHRGQGIGKRMMAAVLAHPDLQGLRRWLLATVDAHGLYAGFGFSRLSAPERLMERLDRSVYDRA
ncbi:MAG: GNAT family N-acetyltransferase [Alphaproteobacteria bacterium]